MFGAPKNEVVLAWRSLPSRSWWPAMSRPQRASAAAARERIHSRDDPHFDGETESDSGEEEVEEEEEAGPWAPAPLSEYELQRQRNIEKNTQKLEAFLWDWLVGDVPAGAGAPPHARLLRPLPPRGHECHRHQPPQAPPLR